MKLKSKFLKTNVKRKKLDRYHVTLNPKVVKDAKEIVLGAKLSPIINNLLKVWIKYPEEIEELIRKLKNKGGAINR